MRKLVEHYHKFIGKDLPPRELFIKFSAPQAGKKVKMPKLSSLRPEKNPHELVNVGAVLQAFQDNLRQLNQCQIRVGRRMAYSEKVARRLMPLALEQVRKLAPDGMIPDNAERKKILDLIADITRRLLDSYRLVFKTLYAAGNFRFARGQKIFDLCAYRLLEFSRFQQRVLALRYQVLSEQAWLTVNIVFHVMYSQGKADLVCHSYEDIFSETHKNRRLQDLYLMLQMNARLDILRWPSEWHFCLDSYGRIVHTLVKLEEDDGNIVRGDYAIAYCYDDCPARAQRIPGQTTRGQGLLLNWKVLKAKLLRDFERNLEHQSQTIDEKAFSQLSFADGLALLELQKNCWQGQPLSLPEKNAQGQKCDVRMFIGFKGIYPFLYNLHYGTGPSEQIGSRMVDLLAQRSALFAEDHRSTTDSIWMMLSQDERRMILKTQETEFTTQMRIGALTAYGFGAEGMRSSAVGCISRIYRPSHDAVVVEIEKLGHNSEPILVIPDLSQFEQFDQQHKEVCYGILAVNMRQDKEECALLLPAHSQLLEGHQLVMKRVGKRQVIVIGKLQEATKTYRKYGYQVQMSMDVD